MRLHSQGSSGEGCCVIISYMAPTCEHHLRAVTKEPRLAGCTSRCPEGLAQPRWTKVRDAGFSPLQQTTSKPWNRSPKWIKFSLGFCDQGGKGKGRGRDSLLMTSGRAISQGQILQKRLKLLLKTQGQGASTDTRRLSLLAAASFLKLRFHTECSGSEQFTCKACEVSPPLFLLIHEPLLTCRPSTKG